MTALPLQVGWGNLMYGETYGLEVWGNYQPASWWRLSAGFNLLHENLRFRPQASTLNSLAIAGDDPATQASVRSSVNLGHRVTWETDVRYVGALPNPRIPAYTEANMRIAWDVSRRLQLSISGENLLSPQHLEYEEAGQTIGHEVERSVSAGLRLKF
jgi:iron complex outermembrane receptor protein